MFTFPRPRPAVSLITLVLLTVAAALACGEHEPPETADVETAPAPVSLRLPGIADAQPQSIQLAASQEGQTTLAAYTVPETDTAIEIKPGLRRYDAHLARMLGITAAWCPGRSGEAVIDWRFWAAGGSMFLGSIPIPCSMAEALLAEIGAGESETTSVEGYAAGDAVEAMLPDVSTSEQVSKLRSAFRATLVVLCADGLCPGERSR
jgi:hypothetical protein